MRRVTAFSLLFLLLTAKLQAVAQTLPPPTAPAQIVIVITPTPEVWPTETPIPPTPTETLTPTPTPAYADVIAFATVQFGEDDPGQLTSFRYEMTAGEVLNAVLLACVLGLLLLDVLLRMRK